MAPRHITCSLLALAFLAGCTGPQTVKPGAASAPAMEKATRVAMGIFFRACVANPQQAKAQAWLNDNGFMQVPPGLQAPFLQGEAGSAWLRRGAPSPIDRLAVVTHEKSGQCEVLAPATQPDVAAGLFSQFVEAQSKPELALHKEADEEVMLGDGKPRRFVAYRIGAPTGGAGSYLLAMTARNVVENGISLVLSFGPAAPGAAAMPAQTASGMGPAGPVDPMPAAVAPGPYPAAPVTGAP